MEAELRFDHMTSPCREPFVWELNLDAEYEMAGQTLASSGKNAQAALPRAAFPFVAAHDFVIGWDPEIPTGYRGQAWCPTERALAKLHSHGARTASVPAMDVLRAVNHRSFLRQSGWPLADTVFAESVDEAIAALRRPGSWFAKRPLSAAGRGKRAIDPHRWSDADERWVRASLRRFGALLVEPRVHIEQEFSIHGLLEPTAYVQLSAPKVQSIGPGGQWTANMPLAGELTADQAQGIRAEARRMAALLSEAGYFGPFGIDAYKGHLNGQLVFVPCSEVNARYTLGWSL